MGWRGTTRGTLVREADVKHGEGQRRSYRVFFIHEKKWLHEEYDFLCKANEAEFNNLGLQCLQSDPNSFFQVNESGLIFMCHQFFWFGWVFSNSDPYFKILKNDQNVLIRWVEKHHVFTCNEFMRISISGFNFNLSLVKSVQNGPHFFESK